MDGNNGPGWAPKAEVSLPNLGRVLLSTIAEKRLDQQTVKVQSMLCIPTRRINTVIV